MAGNVGISCAQGRYLWPKAAWVLHAELREPPETLATRTDVALAFLPVLFEFPFFNFPWE
jgi:hypothetical protein